MSHVTKPTKGLCRQGDFRGLGPSGGSRVSTVIGIIYYMYTRRHASDVTYRDFIWATLCVWEVLHAGQAHNVPYIRDLVVYGKFTLEMVHITNNLRLDYGDGCVPGCVH